ncbi:MAG TPA: hypothetical protein VKM55_04465 [Candidatus Lokiarchaeia archaeon]|nr:hypothetical protein [Candidatus Lokiarchaeia archaeon]
MLVDEIPRIDMRSGSIKIKNTKPDGYNAREIAKSMANFLRPWFFSSFEAENASRIIKI